MDKEKEIRKIEPIKIVKIDTMVKPIPSVRIKAHFDPQNQQKMNVFDGRR